MAWLVVYQSFVQRFQLAWINFLFPDRLVKVIEDKLQALETSKAGK